VASLASTYVMYGFDTASSPGEESRDPRRNAPKAILRALIASSVIGGLILLFALMAVGDINNPEISKGGLQFIVLDVLGGTVGKLPVGRGHRHHRVHPGRAIRRDSDDVRDGAGQSIARGEKLAGISPKTKTPVIPAVINANQPQIFTVTTSIGIIMIYLAYLLVTVPMLIKRLRGEWPPKDGGEAYFSLGKLGLPINVLGVLWGAGIVVKLTWPRRDVYNATPPYRWYLQWGAVLFVGIVAGVGFAYYWFVLGHKSGVLADHAAESTAIPNEEAAQ
jgi:amino acid transporter